MVSRVLGKKERNVNKNNDKLPTMYIKILVFYLKYRTMVFSPVQLLYRKSSAAQLFVPSSNPNRHLSLSPWFPLSENESSQIFYNQEKDLKIGEGGSQYFLLAEKDKSVV
jgi:hypothetical protein